jgi:organic hydroperoxide reductase OsmC/OhrA
MSVRAKRFEYVGGIDGDGRLVTGEGAALALTPEWSATKLVLAALAKCALSSLRHHAERAGLTLSGTGRATGVVTRRDGDGRFALAEVACELDVTLSPKPTPDLLPALLFRAERDCFVGASLAIAPRYAWTVNGVRMEPAPPPRTPIGRGGTHSHPS